MPRSTHGGHGNSSVDGQLDVGFHVSHLSPDIVAAMTLTWDLQSIWPETLVACVATVGLVSDHRKVAA